MSLRHEGPGFVLQSLPIGIYDLPLPSPFCPAFNVLKDWGVVSHLHAANSCHMTMAIPFIILRVL